MHDRVRAPPSFGDRRPEPPIEREVVVRRGHVRRVVGGNRIGTEAARRLDRDEHVAEALAGEVQRASVDIDVARRESPHGFDARTRTVGQRREPTDIRVDGQRAGGARHFGRAQLRVLVGESGSEVFHERVAVSRDV